MAVLQCWDIQLGLCLYVLHLLTPMNHNYYQASLLIRKDFLTFVSTSLTVQLRWDLEFEGIDLVKACNNMDLGWSTIFGLWLSLRTKQQSNGQIHLFSNTFSPRFSQSTKPFEHSFPLPSQWHFSHGKDLWPEMDHHAVQVPTASGKTPSTHYCFVQQEITRAINLCSDMAYQCDLGQGFMKNN